jgi:hypothetical protein
MVRLPPGFHPQAARRGGSALGWRPGYAGTGRQPIVPVPIGRYTQKVSGVPLTGGQNQGTISGFPSGSGSATSPVAGQLLAASVIATAATYTVKWSVSLGGTLSAGDADNFVLYLDNTLLATSVNAAAAGTYPQAPVTFTAAAGQQLAVTLPANATSGAVYTGAITGQSAPFTLTAGPQGLGTVWYPAQVTLSTTTGALDTSVASLYLGSQGVPITQVGQVFSGNGTAALAIPSMSPGQVLIVTWTGGHAGDTAAFNIVGSMDALSTG